ncbi:MAG: hypothetical protein JW885_05270 [Deltaproteobacteria bacterium]|nr:hypothetical protein [Candidatus Zymogenaceae bacterium]
MNRYRFGDPVGQALAILFCALVLSLAGMPALSQENGCGHSGYLWGGGASATFEVFVDTEAVALDFDWPQGIVDFRVKGYGDEPEELLIDQPLADGDLLTLAGPGIYYITIYSKWGSGCWEVTIEPTTLPEEDADDDATPPANEM